MSNKKKAIYLILTYFSIGIFLALPIVQVEPFAYFTHNFEGTPWLHTSLLIVFFPVMIFGILSNLLTAGYGYLGLAAIVLLSLLMLAKKTKVDKFTDITYQSISMYLANYALWLLSWLGEGSGKAFTYLTFRTLAILSVVAIAVSTIRIFKKTSKLEDN